MTDVPLRINLIKELVIQPDNPIHYLLIYYLTFYEGLSLFIYLFRCELTHYLNVINIQINNDLITYFLFLCFIDVHLKRQSIDLCRPFTSKMAAAVEFSIAYSIYSPAVSIAELTTAQVLVLSLFHNLLMGDLASVIALISLVDHLPQMRSSFISVWLRDDFRFCQEHVAKVLNSLSQLTIEDQFVVPQPIVNALVGLEEKYDVFNYLDQSGDTTAQYLLACLNPLVTRATQVRPDDMQVFGTYFTLPIYKFMFSSF